VNAQHLRALPEAERVARVSAFLEARGVDLSARGAEWRVHFVRALGDRLKTLRDAESYGRFALHEHLETDAGAWAELLARPALAERLTALADALASDAEFSAATVEPVTREVAAALGVKAGELISAARVALTGGKVSPGIFDVMALVGRERAVQRLRAAAARWAVESPLAAGA
jgi:glutamyl-tRNA synthetase